MNLRLILLFAISALLFFQCSDDDGDTPSLPVDQAAGTYNGTYWETDCDDITGSFGVEIDNVELILEKTSDNSLNGRLGLQGALDILAFEASIETDTTFLITPFTYEDQTLTGRGFFGGDLSVLFWQDGGCTFLGTPILIARFNEN